MTTHENPQLKTKKDEAYFLAREIKALNPLSLPDKDPVIQPPERKTQWDIIYSSIDKRIDPEQYLNVLFPHPFAQNLHRADLWIEYTTIQLAREFALAEKNLHRQGRLDFFVHTAGMELAQLAIQRHLSNNDAFLAYYRGQATDLYRGGTPEELLAQDLHRVGDTHSKSRQLGGHIASATRGEIPAISITGPHFLTAVGLGTAFNDRIKRIQPSNGHFNSLGSIAVAETGEATMAQGEVMEAVSQAVKDKSAVVFITYNNLAGISMGIGDSSVGRDPILFARAFTNHGLLIRETNSTNLVQLVQDAKAVVDYTRGTRKPSLFLINDLYRVTDHTSSAQQEWYTPPNELDRRKAFDFLSRYRQLIIQMGVATEEELNLIDRGAKEKIQFAVEEVLSRPIEDPEKVYEDVYSRNFKFSPLIISHNPAIPTVDHLENTRTPGVKYADTKTKSGSMLSGRQYNNLVLAQEMRRDPRIVVYGEDVATITRDDWEILPDFLKQKVEQKKSQLTEEEITLAESALKYILKGDGVEADPQAIAAFAHIMDGKGGVFKNTQMLDWFFGRDRLFNFPIREASIIGTAIGRALAGQLPVVEIQFDAYTSPAFQQLHDYLSNLRWRGAGQFGAGMVVRLQGMNRVGGNGIDKAGGVGGIGHGAADISRFLVPGLRHFIPGDVEDMGCGLREAIRVAGKYQEPVLVYEAINMYNDKGYYQGSETHIPLGEAEVIASGDNLLFISWSNNVRIAKKVAETLTDKGYSIGLVNARSIGDQFDWPTIIPEVKKASKVMIFEAGRKDGGVLAAQLQQQLFDYLDAPVVWYPARYVPMPAGEQNEAYVVPQYENVLQKASDLILY